MQGKLKFSKGRAQRPRGQGWLLAEIPLAAAEVREQMPLLLVLEPAFWKGSLGMAGEAGEKKQQILRLRSFQKWGDCHTTLSSEQQTQPLPILGEFGLTLSQASITSVMASVWSPGCTMLWPAQCSASLCDSLFHVGMWLASPPEWH